MAGRAAVDNVKRRSDAVVWLPLDFPVDYQLALVGTNPLQAPEVLWEGSGTPLKRRVHRRYVPFRPSAGGLPLLPSRRRAGPGG